MRSINATRAEPRVNWAQTGLIHAVTFYKLAISPFLPRACRFHPSCSSYAILAIRKYGIFKGIIKSSYRILRCNPWCQCGEDFP